MKTSDVAERILLFNRGRQPELLRMKLDRMRQDAFIFLRGACHLFYEHWPTDSVLNEAPRVWLCGDLHLENFGSFKADNRLVHFDINDFDEAELAPCTWDVARLLTSVLVGADSLKIRPRDKQTACQVCLDAYCRALAAGRARWVERETAKGLVRDLLESLRDRRRKRYLNGRAMEPIARRRTARLSHRGRIDRVRRTPTVAAGHAPRRAGFSRPGRCGLPGLLRGLRTRPCRDEIYSSSRSDGLTLGRR